MQRWIVSAVVAGFLVILAACAPSYSPGSGLSPDVRDRFVRIETETGQDIGSGVVLDNGTILTAEHVLTFGDTYIVHFRDGNKALGKIDNLPSSHPDYDLGILTVSLVGFTPIDLGCYDPAPAQQIYLDTRLPIVAPDGMSVLYTGHVLASGYEQTHFWDQPDEGMFWIDTYSIPGQSGSPAFDTSGRLIGILSIGFQDTNYSGPFPEPVHVSVTGLVGGAAICEYLGARQ